MAELERLLALEQHNIPYFLAADKETALPITRQRSFVAAIDYLLGREALVEWVV